MGESSPERRDGWTRGRVVFLGFLAATAYLLFTEHRAHVLQALPWAILALCPLMHFFMHGRGHHASGEHHRGDEDRR